MDDVLAAFTSFTDAITIEDLTPETVHQVIRLSVDATGCMIGGRDGPPSQIARRLARKVSGDPSATVVGLGGVSTLEMAVFANTAMTRYLDFNDTTIGPIGGGGHFSDMIPALLAIAESEGRTGAELIAAIVAAYEVTTALSNVTRVRERGWDYATWLSIGIALAGGKLLGLRREQLGHAASIAAISNIATRQMRVGELSMWKGCATAWANRNGCSAALLAREGMTAPEEPFAGKDGIMDLIIGQTFSVELPLPLPEPTSVQLANIKIVPSSFNTQGPAQLMMRLREQIPIDEVERIDVGTYWMAYSENGMEPAKWDPKTRETADHSLPYVIAIALVDGEVTLDSFEEARYSDPSLRPLLNRITVREVKEYEDRYPEEFMTNIRVELRSGEVVEGLATHAYGHRTNPASDASIDLKFSSLCRSTGQVEICEEIKAALWELDSLSGVQDICAKLGRIGAR